jgi:nitrile hydratase
MMVLQILDSRAAQNGGAMLVARAWSDPAFKARLLEDGNATAAELGLEGSNYDPREDVPEGESVITLHVRIVMTDRQT